VKRSPLKRRKPIKRVPRETVRAMDRMLGAIKFDPPKKEGWAIVNGKRTTMRSLAEKLGAFPLSWAPRGMKRSATITRPRRKPLDRRGSKMTRKARKPLKRQGARSRREAVALAKFRAALEARSPVCEVCGGARQPGWPLDPHHIAPKARSVGWPLKNDPEINGLLVCRTPCHDNLTLDPTGGWLGPGVRLDARRRIARGLEAFERWRAGSR